MTQLTFHIGISGQTELLVGQVIYMQDSNNLAGLGTLKMPFSSSYSDLIQDNAPVRISAGTLTENALFNGICKHVVRDNTEISVDIVDNGRLFKTPFAGTYNEKELQDVVTELVKNSGHNPIFDKVSVYTLEKRINRSSVIEYGALETPDTDVIIGDTSTTVTGAFHPSCIKCLNLYADMSYISSVKNYCPKCKQPYVISYIDGEYYCDPDKGGCSAHYCGIDGYEKVSNPFYQLTLTYGPIPGDKTGTKPKFSASGTTCESELKQICEANNLYLYITPVGDCIIREFNGFPYPDIQIPNYYVKEDTLNTLQTLATKIQGVDVTYNSGTLSADLNGITDDSTKQRIKVLRKELDKASAQILANNMLVQQLKNLRSDINIDLPIDPVYMPGKWIRVPYFSKEVPLNIATTKHKIIPGVSTTSVRLKMYPAILSQNDLYNSTLPGEETYEQIAKTASKFDFNFVCHDGACMFQKKMGDTFAMSDYLYDKLTGKGYIVRIIEYDYPSLVSKKARYIQLQNGSTWNDFEYEKFEFDTRYWPPAAKTNVKVVQR